MWVLVLIYCAGASTRFTNEVCAPVAMPGIYSSWSSCQKDADEATKFTFKRSMCVKQNDARFP